MHVNELSGIDDLNHADQLSRELPTGVVLFKHSTRCFISRSVWQRFNDEWSSDNSTPLYYLDLLEHRDVSSEIAQRYGIQHQSPQVLLIRNGICVYHASHENISAPEITKFTAS
jgi:bacillithiol system protein YtxJ